MQRGLLVLFVLALLLTGARRAEAYPTLLRHGQPNCALCHADPSGGELLNDYGRLQGRQLLTQRYSRRDTAPPNTEYGPLWDLVDPPPWLLIGGAYRHALYAQLGEQANVVQFPMMADAQAAVAVGVVRAAASVGAARVPVGSPHVRPAQITRGQGDQWNLISRSHWLGLDVRGTTLVRAGRLNLPFGLRLPEHTAWVREASRTDRESDQQHGVAVAYTASETRAELMAILGNYQVNPDRFRERGYSFFVEGALSSRAAVGVSSKLTHAAADLTTLEARSTTRQAHGVFARWAPTTPVVVLAEVDALLGSRRDAGYVGFARVDVEPVRGLHGLLTGEVLDRGFVQRLEDLTPSPEPRRPGVGLPQTGAWAGIAWYFAPQCELRVDGIARYGEPFAVLGQVHLYL